MRTWEQRGDICVQVCGACTGCYNCAPGGHICVYQGLVRRATHNAPTEQQVCMCTQPASRPALSTSLSNAPAHTSNHARPATDIFDYSHTSATLKRLPGALPPRSAARASNALAKTHKQCHRSQTKEIVLYTLACGRLQQNTRFAHSALRREGAQTPTHRMMQSLPLIKG